METKDNKLKRRVHVPDRLQRFLRTVARRDGMISVHVGVVVLRGRRLGLKDGCIIPSKDTRGDDMAFALESLMEDIGFKDFQSGRYLGWFDLESKDGGLFRQYNFEMLLEDDPDGAGSNALMRKKPDKRAEKVMSDGLVFIDIEDIAYRRLPSLDRRTARAITSLLRRNGMGLD